mmetsp:Transcript_27104/g.45180  ORF Transcript_27104/g.45180 Transcript_27104/m.45180 type:complete len:551 (+) Transcript_27104:90-1742(+)|eukprot:CAMPEP_0119015126 /NCGR_PEP_ID=MMETSP1176-20130426/10569_1 /TAXON_ID=265551 /ORGANISM="Synedropsis recta cf, Strain CCMP1620" /LENGTH=550 /DNA_ID=CAMNT_0006968395 /DNA_START=67 /DNA_END=1719 /DNA_ORIENTATION=+
MIYRFLSVTAVLLAVATVKGCSVLEIIPDGTFVSKIQTTTNPNELLAHLTTFDEGIEVSKNTAIMKLDEESVKVIKNVDANTVLEAATPLEGMATGGYSVDLGAWPNVTLGKSGATSISIMLLDPFDDLPATASQFVTYMYFVVEGLAYIMYESRSQYGDLAYAIVDFDDEFGNVMRNAILSNSNVEFFNTPVVYNDIGVVAIRGQSSLCIGRVYFAYNATNIIPIYTSFVGSVGNLLDAVSEAEDVAYGLVQDFDYGEEYATPGPAHVIKTSLETGERVEFSFTLGQVQICFPGNAVVHVQDKGLVRIDTLVIGDLVQVANDRFEPVYSFGHKNPSYKYNFLEIATSDSNSTPLVISPDHMIATPNDGFVPAVHLEVGEFVLGGADGSKVQILAIKDVKAQGAFAPFTPSGTLIVNGILASSFIAVEYTSLNLVGVEFSWQWMAHTFEFPHRVACHYLGRRCPDETYDDAGMSSWVSAPLEAGHWVLKQKGAVRNILLGLSVVVLIIFAAMEQALMLVYPLATALWITMAASLVVYYHCNWAREKVKTV